MPPMNRTPLTLLAMLIALPLLSGCAMWFPKAPMGIYQTQIETAEWRERVAKDPSTVPYSHR